MNSFLPGTNGSGPGEFGVDGSPVQVYAEMPCDTYSANIIHAAIPPGAFILEMGCGTGRVTHPLIELGHRVTAVDGSREMLAHVRGARLICARIEELDLYERFDVVLLMSDLVEYGQREQLLASCRRHVKDGGSVIIQRLLPRAFRTLDAFEYQTGEVHHRISTARPGPRLLAITVEHRIGHRVWFHSGTARQLTDDELPRVLATAGLRFDRFLSTDGWIVATPADAE